MNKIEYRQGDLLTTDCIYILHGCNTQGVMGSGVAKAIRDKYPRAYRDYFDTHNNHGLCLGDIITSKQPDGKIVLNGITQQTYGRTGVHVSYWAIAEVLRKINSYYKIEEVALPKIGSGLAGGDWKVIEAIIENTSTNFKPIVYVL